MGGGVRSHRPRQRLQLLVSCSVTCNLSVRFLLLGVVGRVYLLTPRQNMKQMPTSSHFFHFFRPSFIPPPQQSTTWRNISARMPIGVVDRPSFACRRASPPSPSRGGTTSARVCRRRRDRRRTPPTQAMTTTTTTRRVDDDGAIASDGPSTSSPPTTTASSSSRCPSGQIQSCTTSRIPSGTRVAAGRYCVPSWRRRSPPGRRRHCRRRSRIVRRCW